MISDSASKNTTDPKGIVIPIAGGKGGVGKSIITANLSIALARLGHSTVVIDLDLGASNLHFMLGLQNEYKGIGDYFRSDDIEFGELGVQTEWPKLRFIPGEGRIPFLANITFAQKNNLIKKIRELDADYIILDLSAGASFNVLDFFNMDERGLVVTTPDRISVINMLSFIKQSLLRKIDRAFARKGEIREIINEMMERPMTESQIPISALIEQLKMTDRESADHIARICETFRPSIAFNMLREPKHLRMANIVDKSVDKVLSLAVDHVGAVPMDREVNVAIDCGQPLLKNNPDSRAARSIFNLAGQLDYIRTHNTTVDCQEYIQTALKMFKTVREKK